MLREFILEAQDEYSVPPLIHSNGHFNAHGGLWPAERTDPAANNCVDAAPNTCTLGGRTDTNARATGRSALVDVSHLLDFVREGIYKNSDGVGGAAWLDYDGDGFLDLYITNTREAKNALFRNNGDGTFTNAAGQAGVTSETGNTAVVAGDFDNDGCTDLILAGDGGFQGNRAKRL